MVPRLRTLVVLLLVTVVARPLHAQTPVTPPADGPARIVARLQTLAQSGSASELEPLIAASVPPSALADFSLDFFVPGVTHAVARELDRIPLPDVPEGAGFSLIVEVFSEVEPDPSIETVVACADRVRALGCELIIGLGGGSAIDTAKCASVMATNPGNVEDYLGIDKVAQPGVPKIIIPTTAGTGSEVTNVAVPARVPLAVKILKERQNVLSAGPDYVTCLRDRDRPAFVQVGYNPSGHLIVCLECEGVVVPHPHDIPFLHQR
mgnify:CR=1 FL=1